MSNEPEIPLDKVDPKTLAKIAGSYWRGRTWVSLTVSFIAVLGVLGNYVSQHNQSQVVKQVVADAATQKVELRIEREHRVKLEAQLVSVQELLKAKDKEIAELHDETGDLQDEMEVLKKEFEDERESFKIREKELIERIASLKLQDGNPNSFK